MGICPAELPDVRTSTPVTRVEPASGDRRAVVHAAGCAAEQFDAVIFATHTDTTLAALGSAAPEVVAPTSTSTSSTKSIDACLDGLLYSNLIGLGMRQMAKILSKMLT